MTVTLTVSKTLGGAGVADTLAGGSSGLDLGSCTNSEYAPITLKSANTGFQPLYVSHDGVIDPITDVKTFVAAFSGTYGGAGSPANDYATLKAKGFASSTSANNGDGLGSGLRVEHDADIPGSLGLSAFDATRGQVKIYGAANLGIDLATAYPVHVDAMIRNNAGTPVDATTPETGKIGKSGDTVLGDVALVKLRFYLEEDGATVVARPEGGILQWDWVIAYSFTA